MNDNNNDNSLYYMPEWFDSNSKGIEFGFWEYMWVESYLLHPMIALDPGRRPHAFYAFVFFAELQRASRASKAPLVRKIGNVTVRTSFAVQTLGEGERRLNVTSDFGCSQLMRFIYLLRSLSHQN